MKLPESFGINGLRAGHPDGVDGLIAQVLAPHGPVLADIRAEKCEHVFPMIPAGAAYNGTGLSTEDEARAARTAEGHGARLSQPITTTRRPPERTTVVGTGVALIRTGAVARSAVP